MRRITFGVTAGYVIDDETSLRFGILHEAYRSSALALDGVEPATVPALLTLAEQSPRYTVDRIMLTCRRTF